MSLRARRAKQSPANVEIAHLHPICPKGTNRAFPGTARHYSPHSEAEWEGRCGAMQVSSQLTLLAMT